ncbi:MAG: hypothetical protein KC563_14165, partial [Nitrospira sp.]|nr:hypothetical protein [Nitrospira sp.]
NAAKTTKKNKPPGHIRFIIRLSSMMNCLKYGPANQFFLCNASKDKYRITHSSMDHKTLLSDQNNT